MSDDLSNYATQGTIARQHSVPLHRVVYAMRCLGIEPVATMGGRNFNLKEHSEQIGRELRAIDARRRRVNRAVKAVRAGGFSIEPADEMFSEAAHANA